MDDRAKQVDAQPANTERAMAEAMHRTLESNGMRMRVAERGEGPVVLLCHGFPESWYSSRYQLAALAEAGFRTVAPDMRGYGGTDPPEAVDQYTLLHLVGDVVGLFDALGAATAVIAGHDWGAQGTQHAALLRPDRFVAVVDRSVPYRPRGKSRPTTTMPQTADRFFYQLYFRRPGVPEAEFERDVRHTIGSILYSISGDDAASGNGTAGSAAMVDRKRRSLAELRDPDDLPPWVSEADVDFYVREFTRSGFRGGLIQYRNIDRSWELLAPFVGSRVNVPALYIAGDRDVVMSFPSMDQIIANLPTVVPQPRRTVILPDYGHWTQQERAEDVNAAMLDFLHHS